MATRIEPILTVDDLVCMPDDGNRYELIEGELFMSRAPDLLHQIITANLVYFFKDYLRENPIGLIVPTPGVIFSKYSSVIPDLVYISNERRKEIATGKHVTGAPDLAVEILSPGAENEHRDRAAKRQLYGKYGVKEYWIVDPKNKTVEIYRLQKRGLRLVVTLSVRDEIPSPLLPSFICAVKGAFET
ncbi:MAG TPA: Uma2 family endonuclease [Blastocatellia bacterium]